MKWKTVSHFCCFKVLLILMISSVQCIEEHEKSMKQKLREMLLKNYDSKVHPGPHHSSTVNISVSLTPLYVIDLDEEASMFTLDSWIKMGWKDFRLQWNKESYDGLSVLHFHESELWKPDVVVYNSHGSNIDPRGNTHMLAMSDGSVLWVPPATLQTRCFYDAPEPGTGYPFDSIHCSVVLGSWTEHGYSINLVTGDGYEGKEEEDISSKAVSLPYFKNNNPNWQLLEDKVTAFRQVKYYNCCAEPYVSMEFNFILQRRLPSPIKAVTIPLRICAVLGLAIFWIPGNLTKLTFGMTIFIALVLLHGYIALETLPSHVQHIAVQPVQNVMLTIMIIIVLEIIVINLSRLKDPPSPPQMLTSLLNSKIVRYTLLLLCTSPPEEKKSGDTTNVLSDTEHHATEKYSSSAEIQRRREWHLLSNALDRFLFIIFIVIIAVQI